jgi:hypothetical protein
MSTYYGDYPVNHTAVIMTFDSFAATGASSATSSFVNTDIQIYKDGGTTQRASAAGIAVSTSFDGLVGLQLVTIDLSDNTDAGFYASGHEYQVAVADITIDSQTVRFWLGTFSIERTGLANLFKTVPAIARGTVGSSPSTTSLPTSAFAPAGAAADQFKGRVVLFDATTTTTGLRGCARLISASSNAATPTLTVDTLPATPVSGDVFSVV